MNKRRWIYLVVFLAVFFLIYQNDKMQDINNISFISKDDLVKDFANLKDNQDLPEPVLGGTFHAVEMYFPADFMGQKGDAFYVYMEDGHIGVTQYYLIHPESEDEKAPLTYKVKDSWENFRIPEGKYESYDFTEQVWKKV